MLGRLVLAVGLEEVELPAAEIHLFGDAAIGAEPVEDLPVGRIALQELRVEAPELLVGGVAEAHPLLPVERRDGDRELVQRTHMRRHLGLELEAERFGLGRVDADAARAEGRADIHHVEHRAPAAEDRGDPSAIGRFRILDGDPFPQGAVDQLQPLADHLVGVTAFHRLGIGLVHPGEPAIGVAQPDLVGQRVEHGLQRRHLAGEPAELLLGADALQPVAGHLADPHDGAPRHRAALDLEPLAVRPVGRELEALALLPQALDSLLEPLRIGGGEPLRVAEDAPRPAGADHHAHVAFDLGLPMGRAPGDDHLALAGHEDLGPLQLGLQFADLGVLRGEPPPPAVPSRDMERRRRRREEQQADEDEAELVAHVHHDRLVRIAREQREAQADVLGC